MNSYGKTAKQDCMEQMRQISVECSLEEIDELLDFFRQVEKDFEENGVAGKYVAEMERKEKHPDEPIFNKKRKITQTQTNCRKQFLYEKLQKTGGVRDLAAYDCSLSANDTKEQEGRK